MIPALRDVSLIILIVPCMICLLVPLAILLGTNWALRKGRKGLKPKLQSAQQVMHKIDEKVDRAGEKIASPFIAAEANSVKMRTWWRHLQQQFTKDKQPSHQKTGIP